MNRLSVKRKRYLSDSVSCDESVSTLEASSLSSFILSIHGGEGKCILTKAARNKNRMMYHMYHLCCLSYAYVNRYVDPQASA